MQIKYLRFMSANIMTSICCAHVRIGVHVNNFSKGTRLRDMLFLLKDTLSIEDENLFQGMQICFLEP